MAVLVNADFNTASMYRGMNVTTKVGSKKHKVLFKIACDDLNLSSCINLAKESSNVVCLDYQGLDENEEYRGIKSSDLYILKQFHFGNDINEDDVRRIVESLPTGVTPIIKLEDDFKDLKFVCDMCSLFPKLRFSGGNLFRVDGVRLGYVDSAILDDLGIKYTNDFYTTEVEDSVIATLDADKLEFTVSTKPERKAKAKKANKPSVKGKKTSSKPAKRKENPFANLMSTSKALPF